MTHAARSKSIDVLGKHRTDEKCSSGCTKCHPSVGTSEKEKFCKITMEFTKGTYTHFLYIKC